ncbi:MAG: DUF2812 domain-containing protein [Eubacteriaceae bacterium]|nr:DUF2812 domain-containing protein [Eubacteriaceae bacterium]
MSRTVLKIRYIDPRQIGEFESWLSHMSKQGLHLKSLGSISAEFDRGEVVEHKYRVDFNTSQYEVFPQEQLEVYRESGWEFIDMFSDIGIFRGAKNAKAPELHTDPDELAYEIRKISRKNTSRNIVPPLLSIALGLRFSWVFDQMMLNLLNYVSSWISLWHFFVSTPILIAISISKTITLQKNLHALRAGTAIDHNVDWKKPLLFAKCAWIAYFVSLLAIIGCLIYSLATVKTMSLSTAYIDEHLIRLADIDKSPLLERFESNQGYSSRSVDYGNMYKCRWSPFAQSIISVSERGIIPGRKWLGGEASEDSTATYSPELSYTIYQLRFSWSEILLRDMLKEEKRICYSGEQGIPPLIKPAEQAEYDHLYISDNEPGYSVFASNGKTVVSLYYRGEASLDLVIEAVTEMFARLS